MISESDIDVIAQRVKAAQDGAGRIEPITSGVAGFSVSDAYEVAHRIHEARVAGGAVPVGRKIGFTNSNIWPKYGVDAPIWGYVYDGTVTRVSGRRTVCGISGFAEPKIEPEIVVHFGLAPPADGDAGAILGCIDWVAHGFEIVQSHYPGWRFRAPDTVADSALHGALLVGEPLSVDRLGPDPAAALQSFSITVYRNGEAVETGNGANVLGSPLNAVAHLLETLAGQPGYPALRAGEMVTTGTLTGAYSVEPGQVWSTELEGVALAGLTVEITA